MAKSIARKELVERELLDCAAELFARNGYNGTSLQEIAESARIGRTTLYHYFRSKEAFLTALVEDVTLGAWSMLHQIRMREDLTPHGQLEAAAKMLVMRVLSNPTRFRVLERDEGHLPSGLAERHRKAKRDSLAELMLIIDAGIMSGEFRPVDPQVTALTVFGMCNWPAWWFNAKSRRNPADVADAISAMAVGAVMRCNKSSLAGPAAIIKELHDDLSILERMIGPRG